jgi:hypothetical protein
MKYSTIQKNYLSNFWMPSFTAFPAKMGTRKIGQGPNIIIFARKNDFDFILIYVWRNGGTNILPLLMLLWLRSRFLRLSYNKLAIRKITSAARIYWFASLLSLANTRLQIRVPLWLCTITTVY